MFSLVTNLFNIIVTKEVRSETKILRFKHVYMDTKLFMKEQVDILSLD